jgi:hypothetical protein
VAVRFQSAPRTTSSGLLGRSLPAAHYDGGMATDPQWHPVDEEIAQVLADDPGLAEELADFDRAYEAGEAELVPDDEVRGRLEARGLRLSPRSPGPSAS